MFQKVNKRITAFVLFAIMLISTVAATLTAYAVNGEKKTEVTAAETKESDFSSKRLIVMTDDESVIQGKGSVIGEYGEVYLLQFETAKEAMEAYASLKDKVTAVEPDIVVEAASTNRGSDIQINETENPVEALNELGDAKASKNNHGVIALIDTGVKKHDNVIDRVSVADDALEGNGHGDAMVKAIVSQDQDAKILSIRAMDDEGFGTISSLVAAMEYAIAQDVDIINLSVYARTTLSTSVLKQEILKADEAGITVVGAAGNDGADAAEYMPGSVKEAYIIGAAKEDGERLKSSNYGKTVDYNVVAESTSEATALFTGFISANGLAGVKNVINDGLIYETDYKAVEASDPFETEDFSNYTVDQSKSVVIRYLFVYADKIKKNDTIETIYDKIFSTNAPFDEYIVGDAEDSVAPVYDAGNGTYKFKADAPLRNGISASDSYQDYVFTKGTNAGEVVTEGVEFNPETGVATVKESSLEKRDGDFANIQLQVLVPVASANGTNEQTVSVYAGNEKAYQQVLEGDTSTYENITLSLTGVEKDLTSDYFEVYLNESPVKVPAVWNDSEKTLTLNEYSDIIWSVKIKVNAKTDAVFKVADATRNTTPMFYLDLDQDEINKLNKKPKHTDPGESSNSDWTRIGRVGYEHKSPKPSIIVGSALSASDTTGFDDGYDDIGWIGIPKDLFGVNFDFKKSNGSSYGYWKATCSRYGNLDSKSHNVGIKATCIHAAKGEAWTADYEIKMYYAIVDAWKVDSNKDGVTDEYRYKLLFYGQRITNGNALGQTAGGTLVFAVKYDNPEGYLKVTKSSSDTSITSGNSNYSLKGAKYTIYTDSACKKSTGKVLTVGSNGSSSAVKLTPGTYYLKETTAPKGYVLDSTVYTAKVTSSHTSSKPLNVNHPCRSVQTAVNSIRWPVQNIPYIKILPARSMLAR